MVGDDNVFGMKKLNFFGGEKEQGQTPLFFF